MSADQEMSLADSLRAIADWVDEHPEFETFYPGGVVLAHLGADQFPAAVRMLGGTREKRITDYSVEVIREFGPMRVTVMGPKEATCTKRVVGTETVEVPATEASTYEREIVEWDCGPVLDGVV